MNPPRSRTGTVTIEWVDGFEADDHPPNFGISVRSDPQAMLLDPRLALLLREAADLVDDSEAMP